MKVLRVSDDIHIITDYVRKQIVSLSIHSKTGVAITDKFSDGGLLAVNDDELPALIEKLTEIQKEIENETDSTQS